LPLLGELRKKYHAQGFEVIAVNLDAELDDALDFLKKHPVDYPILLDPKGKLPSQLDIQAMPTAFLVSDTGVILYKHEGFEKKDLATIESEIKNHFRKK
jgi:peroxiredoxin